MSKFKNINFRTKIIPNKYDFDISYNSKLMLIGSCFTENIGYKLKTAKFNVDINPFGIIYNPISVANSLNFLIEKKHFLEDDIFYFNETWNSYNHHGRFSLPNKDETLKGINKQVNLSSQNLQNSDLLFVTFGTSWVYELFNTNKVVSNCHKVPAKEFRKRILDIDEIVEIYSKLIKNIQKINENLKIIFTISPVRHLKDGFSENMLSKSILKLAINDLVNNNENCNYFPSYEILIDDLRDYRFYKSDLLHPNDIAIEYIFNILGNSCFSENTFKLYNKIIKIIQAKSHRPFNYKSNEYLKFIKKNISKIEKLQAENPFLHLEEESLFFKNKKSDIYCRILKP